MAREHKHAKHPKMRKERIAYGILVSALGCLWLAVDLGWISTTLPLGPIIMVVLGLTMLLPWLEK